MPDCSRDLNDLQDHVKEKALQLLDRCRDEGLDLLMYCTLRPLEVQARLFRQGRPFSKIQEKADELRNKWERPDLADLLINVGPQSETKIVTYAGPGQSMHNYGLAIDSVLMRNGKPVWNSKKPEDLTLWQLYGRLSVEVGFEWAGNWTKFREFPHIQEPGAGWRDFIRQ